MIKKITQVNSTMIFLNKNIYMYVNQCKVSSDYIHFVDTVLMSEHDIIFFLKI